MNFTSAKRLRPKRPRDSQRAKLYAAEKEVDRIETFESVDQVQQYVYGVLRSKWWKENSPTATVFVRDGRRRKRGGAVTLYGIGYIKMPR
jgi:hypothetical protein